MTVQMERHRFTVADYRRMGEVGILPDGLLVELIEGTVIDMPRISSHHAGCVGWFNNTVAIPLHRSVIVRLQNPVYLDEYSEPVPDIALVKRRDDFYRYGHPRPEDILHIIEVSDSTLEYDRRGKVPLYARAGIPEVWIFNLAEERVEVFADPSGGAYQTTAAFSRGEEVQSRALAALRLGVSEIFG
jgi:Uma2 family endonuclease